VKQLFDIKLDKTDFLDHILNKTPSPPLPTTTTEEEDNVSVALEEIEQIKCDLELKADRVEVGGWMKWW